MSLLLYFLYSSVCLGISYLAYLLIFRRSGEFRQLRLFLILSLLISLLIPFSNYRLKFDLPGIGNTETQVSAGIHETAVGPAIPLPATETVYSSPEPEKGVPLQSLLIRIWLIGFFIQSSMILIQSGYMVYLYYKGEKHSDGNFTVIYITGREHSFSFFNWIFINRANENDGSSAQIIAHEKMHALQLHSVDLVLTGLAVCILWFNPLIWMLRSSLRLVHEYLADEGALKAGNDRISYQTLLINQVAGGRLVSLSSSFNSQIKKRMLMMNRSGLRSRTSFKILALLPVAAILFFGVACMKGKDSSKTVAAVALTKMNVLYIGVANPVVIAVSGYDPADLIATIDNGKISGEKGEYVINPANPGTAVLTISCKGKELQQSTFRVKYVPDPVAVLNISDGSPKTEGFISKADLLKAGGVAVELRNFDFDLKFTAKSFVMSTTLANSNTVVEEVSNSDRYTKNQIDLINSLKKYQKLAFENIVATGPDGAERKLGTMVFTVSGD
jgi:hypothetical protein